MRKEVPEIGWGDFTVLKVRDPPPFSLYVTTGAIIQYYFYTIFTNNRAKFSCTQALIANRANCWLIFFLRTTVGLTSPVNTGSCSKAMLTGGIGSADSTICCVETDIDQKDTGAD